MKSSTDKMIIRKLFQNKVYLSDGQSYEDLFSKIMIYSNKNFRPVRPQGSKRDKKNDGYDDVKGFYYQVYAPENLESKIKFSIKKLYQDFEGLYKNWENLKRFYYVLNDKYKATYPDIELALKDIEATYQVECKPFLAKDLEEIFINLEEDQIKMIIGDYSNDYSVVYESEFKYIRLHKNKNFIGRVDYINAISDFLLNKNGVNTIVIKGLAGKGKTQIALEYTFQYQHNYSIILWINAESKETIDADFSEIYYRLGFPSDEVQIEDKVNKIKLFLEKSNSYKYRWLLVFDNATDEDITCEYIPINGNGDVIITSQSDHWFNIDLSIVLDELSEDESFDLLRCYTLVNDEDEALQELSHELGHLPLALVQAGSYIRMAKSTVKRYLENFKIEKNRKYLLSTSSPIGKKSMSIDYDFVISTVWKKTFNTIQECAPLAGKVIQWLAFISTSMFPIEQLRLLIDFIGKDSQYEDSAGTVIGWLTNFSLITLHGEGITIHTLVQLVTRDELEINDKHYILGELSRGLLFCCRYTHNDNKKYLEETNLLIPHYYKVAGFLENEEAFINTYIELLFICGKFLSRENVMFKEAIDTLNKSVYLMEQMINEMKVIQKYDVRFSIFLSIIYNELAYAYEQQGHLNKSIELYQKSLYLGQDIYGHNALDLVNSYNNLAVNYNHLGKNYEAYKYFRKCIEIYNANNVDEKIILTIYNNIGSTLTALGKYDEASKVITWTIERTKEIYGDNYYGLSNLYNNYADILQKFDHYDNAIKYYKESLRISEHRYLDRNPHKETVLNNIGLILIKMFKIDEAMTFFNEALETILSIYGENHLSIAKTYSNIGLAYMEINDFEIAKDFFIKSVIIGEIVYLEPHPEMAKFLNNLGWAHLELNELEEAEDSLRKSIEIKLHIYDSEEYPDFATTYINLGKVFFEKGLVNPIYYKEARLYYEKGLRIDTIIYGELSVEVAIDCINYAGLLTRVNEKNTAIKYYSKALRICQKKFGETHPRVGEIFFYIGSTYFTLKEYKQTKVNLESAVVVLENYLDNENLFKIHQNAVLILNKLM
ncbi:tetratricopeptide repeat protein [Paenibacillus sp. LX16]|uniref:tetratricopeptide repeat protein n=1 Tax=Paenibacillus sp. LX16 TaxID=1740264 RepID=UPI002E27D45D|nr:tetratricopeptide repeat protein [Paenibacillus sp. LX16]